MPIRPVAIVLLLCICSAAAAYEERAPAAVDLSGRWALNAALSDDVDALLSKRLEKQLQRERRRRELEAREQQEEAVPALPSELPRPQVKRVVSQLRRALELYSTLEIAQSDSGAKLEIRGDTNQRRFNTGRSAMSMPEGQLADADVGWDGDSFVIERKVRRGPRMVERYRLLKKTGQLQVMVAWSGDSDDLLAGVKVKRVFDPARGTAPPADPDVGQVR
jgi:hypothetical protein